MDLTPSDAPLWTGASTGSAPAPLTNKAFSKALGKALHRPAFSPVPAFALKVLYGDMAEIVTEGQRAVPERALAGGYAFAHPDLDEALASALG
jgi:NAD dependent epimerase/dehydratase family enzyme